MPKTFWSHSKMTARLFWVGKLLTGAKRSQALASGLGMVASDFLQTVERSGNAFGEGPAARAQLIQSLEIPVYEAGKTEWLLWMGCVWS